MALAVDRVWGSIAIIRRILLVNVIFAIIVFVEKGINVVGISTQ